MPSLTTFDTDVGLSFDLWMQWNDSNEISGGFEVHEIPGLQYGKYTSSAWPCAGRVQILHMHAFHLVNYIIE